MQQSAVPATRVAGVACTGHVLSLVNPFIAHYLFYEFYSAQAAKASRHRAVCCPRYQSCGSCMHSYTLPKQLKRHGMQQSAVPATRVAGVAYAGHVLSLVNPFIAHYLFYRLYSAQAAKASRHAAVCSPRYQGCGSCMHSYTLPKQLKRHGMQQSAVPATRVAGVAYAGHVLSLVNPFIAHYLFYRLYSAQAAKASRHAALKRLGIEPSAVPATRVAGVACLGHVLSLVNPFMAHICSMSYTLPMQLKRLGIEPTAVPATRVAEVEFSCTVSVI
ncbi:hypothetical protein J6590_022603 [Homalodisca vitripennis]|nr:hypothetical protein J6590_022603 [Homalodisca vitripennis]